MVRHVGVSQLATALAARGTGSPLDLSLSTVQFKSQLGDMAEDDKTWSARVPGSFYDYVDRSGVTVEAFYKKMHWPRALVEDPVVSRTFKLAPWKCVSAASLRFSALTVYSRAQAKPSKKAGSWAFFLCAAPG